jgi:hypothetical protein
VWPFFIVLDQIEHYFEHNNKFKIKCFCSLALPVIFFQFFEVLFGINQVDYLPDEISDKIWHFLVFKIFILGEINLQALWDEFGIGDEFQSKSKKCPVGTCGDHAETKIKVIVCHMSPETWQKDLGFLCFEIDNL